MANVHLYDHPTYYDIAFRRGFPDEAQVIEQCFKSHVSRPVRDILEVGCGTGRIVVALAERGYRVTGYDIQQAMVGYARKRIRSAGVEELATVIRKDMRKARFRNMFDVAVNEEDTLGYLLSDDEIITHLRNTADALKPGGVYVIVLTCAWDNLDSDEWETRWVERDNGISIETDWDIESQDQQRKLSRQVCKMKVNDHGRITRFEERHTLRLWFLEDLMRLIEESGRFELAAIYNKSCKRVPITARITGEMGYHLYVLKVPTQ